MGLPDDENGRPCQGGRVSSTATKIGTSVPRCSLCGHRIYASASLAVGIGKDCRRRLRTALEVADPLVRTAYVHALLRLGGAA